MTSYIVVCQQIVGSGPFETVYGWDGKRFDTREAAISHGFRLGRSDDFNIAVLEENRLTSFDWMNKRINEPPEVLAKIAEALGLDGVKT